MANNKPKAARDASAKRHAAAQASAAQQPVKKARFEPTQAKSSKPTVKPKQALKSAQKAPAAAPTPPAPKTFVVSVGSYERLLYGISCEFSSQSKIKVTPIFSFPAHLSSLRTVAASLLPSAQTGSERKVGGKYLVSGGTDEIVKVWDLRRRKEVGSLEGTTSGKPDTNTLQV